MSLYEIAEYWISQEIHWEITVFIIIFLLFRLVYNTELDLDSMTQKEKINHYLCLIAQVIVAFYLAFCPYLTLNNI